MMETAFKLTLEFGDNEELKLFLPFGDGTFLTYSETKPLEPGVIKEWRYREGRLQWLGTGEVRSDLLVNSFVKDEEDFVFFLHRDGIVRWSQNWMRRSWIRTNNSQRGGIVLEHLRTHNSSQRIVRGCHGSKILVTVEYNATAALLNLWSVDNLDLIASLNAPLVHFPFTSSSDISSIEIAKICTVSELWNGQIVGQLGKHLVLWDLETGDGEHLYDLKHGIKNVVTLNRASLFLVESDSEIFALKANWSGNKIVSVSWITSFSSHGLLKLSDYRWIRFSWDTMIECDYTGKQLSSLNLRFAPQFTAVRRDNEFFVLRSKCWGSEYEVTSYRILPRRRAGKPAVNDYNHSGYFTRQPLCGNFSPLVEGTLVVHCCCKIASSTVTGKKLEALSQVLPYELYKLIAIEYDLYHYGVK